MTSIYDRDDFVITIEFNERQNTVRGMSCTWTDREYEATIDWDNIDMRGIIN